MSEILKVLNRNVELKSEKIELGSIDEIKKLNKVVAKEWETGRKIEEKLSTLASDAITAFKQSRVKANELVKIYEKTEKQAKDLGIELPTGILNAYQDAKSAIKDGEEKIKNLQKLK